MFLKIFPSKIWRVTFFSCNLAALNHIDVSHRRLSVGYPLESASGYFYARIPADRRLPFRHIKALPRR